MHFMAKDSDDQIDTMYNIFGEYALIFLYASLGINAFNDYFKELAISQNIFCVVAVLYTHPCLRIFEIHPKAALVEYLCILSTA